MGVPKFFRYISERYPCLSEVVREHQIPEFDNLYLDMNGIIHVCSHPNDNDPHFRISEENIFSDIFHYIETLFRLIQPKRLFFMAVDGVAPRAKMNQQRGRRFRTAKDMTIQEAKAKANNEVLPDAERFDSNCITPGTVFMARLHAQLRYFVSYKISTDKLWQKPTIILSGHETPGEGEHKIMDYIRYMKSQPNYDSNTRHCLYGLDADLIMLGLCTHEPHFSLLREEVKFGRNAKNKVRASVPEEIRFYLLHLSLMREYIDLEFQELKTTLPFPYNLENVIDDWVMMGFLVGNDFIPHLPNLHISNGALPILYKAYKDILPTVSGYINEGGTLNLPRFQKYMEKLAGFDLSCFKDTYADLKYFQMKTGRRPNETERTSYKNGSNDEKVKSDVKDPGLAALIQSTDNMLLDDAREGGNDIFYSSDEDIDDDEADDAMMFAEFYQHKNNYYIDKLEYTKVTDDVLQSQAEGYVRAIQWNLHYYYDGCCSWSWFYPHHYAPFISDIKNFENFKLEFNLGEPFLPFQQLLAVLPSGSKKLLPEPFQELMVNEDSPIIEFYPNDFKTDMNGKKQEWEAVVLIPFINQDSLLKAMATKYDRLTDEEKRRNSHGPMLVYNYTPENQGMYEAPEYYPALNRCYAKEVAMSRESIFVEQSKLVKGLCPDVRLDVYFPGFPTLNHLKFTAELKKAKVKVFTQASLGDNMILTLKENPDFSGPLLTIAMNIIDKTVFVNWPHLTEAKVVAVANESKRIVMKHSADGSSTLVTEDLTQDFTQRWRLSKKGIEEEYFSKMGVNCKNTEVLVYACNLEGRKYVFTNNGRVSYEKKWMKIPSSYAAQTLVRDIAVNEPEFTDNLTLNELFKPASICFTLGTPHYGAMGTVCEGGKNGRIKLSVCITLEPELEPAFRTAHQCRSSYIPGHVMSQRLGISSHLLSRLTGSIFVVDGERGGGGSGSEHPQKTNIGLNLKFTKKNEEVCGYTRKENGQWLYSTKAEQLINDYMKTAPDVISYIASNVGNDIYYVNDIFPENSAEEMKKLTTWLSEQDFVKAERLTCGSEVLQEEVVSVIEKIIDFTKNKTAKTVVMQIKPHLLLIPKANVTGLCPDSNAIHKVFDRIVCVRESFTVPLGMKGTITGIQTAENEDDVIYDVVFDKEFPGGIKLRCSSNRGYRMTRKGFLNLSHGVRLENNKVRNNASNNPVHLSEYDRFDSSASWNNSQRNSAFASCNIKGNQTNRQQDHSSMQQFHKQKTQMAGIDTFLPKFTANSDKEGKVQGASQLDSNKPASEFQAMWNELKKAGTKPLNQGGQAAPPSGDASDVLKKMLKIADTSPKRKPNTSNSLPSSREVHKDGDKSIPCDSHDESSSVQLENYLSQRGGGKPVYSYEPSECNGKSYMVAKVFLDLPPDLEKSFTGRPSVDSESAMESAAVAALHGLRSEDQSGVESLSKPSESTVPTGFGNNASTRRPTYPANSYGLQNIIGSPNLPQPPPLLGFNNSIRQQANHFQHRPQYRNNGSNSGHRMNNAFNNWFNSDLPTPPQQWYQNNRPPHQNSDGRHLDWNQRNDSQIGNGGVGNKQHFQPHQFFSPSQHQHLPLQSYQNFPYQRSNANMVGQNAPNWRQMHPIPPLVGQTPFIPLQAITQCRTRPSSCSNFISTGTNNASPMQQGSGQTMVDGSITNNVPSVGNQSRPSTVMSQPRRSRIAANFNVKLD